MHKISKVITGILSLAVAFSGTPVLAEDGVPTAEFHNYTVSAIEADVDAYVNEEEAPYTGDTFAFIVTEEGKEDTSTVINAVEAGQFNLNFMYDEPGDHIYTVIMRNDGDPNVRYDENTYRIEDKVTLVEEADGSYSLQLDRVIYKNDEAADQIVFDFGYIAPDPIQEIIQVHKTYDGEDYSGDGFVFYLTDEEGNELQRISNTVDGIAAFEPVEFTEMGSYRFMVFEETGSDEIVVYDKNYHSVEVLVTMEQDPSGRNILVASEKYLTTEEYDGSVAFRGGDTVDDLTVTFVNKTIDPISVRFGSGESEDGDATGNAGRRIEKIFNAEKYDGTAFSFELKDSDGNVIQTTNKVEDGEIILEPVEFTRPGKYLFTLSEVRGEDETVYYDPDVYTIEVSVFRVEDHLEYIVSYSLADTEVEEESFSNFTIDPVKVQLLANKYLDEEAYDGDEFEFELVDEEGSVVDSKKAVKGIVTFDEFEIEAPGVLNWKLREVIGEDPAVEYDETVYDVIITVTRDMDKDSYDFSVQYMLNGKEVDIPRFDNKLIPAVVKISGQKTYNALPYTGTEFQYVLADENGKALQVTNIASAGKFEFEKELSYTKEGVYKYKVYEPAGSQTAVLYDDTIYEVTVTVTRDLEKGITAEAAYTVNGKKAEEIVFANEPRPIATSYQFTARKMLDNKAYNGTQFVYELYDADGKRIQANNIATNGVVNFGAIRYEKVGRYTYSVKERAGDNAKYKFDNREYKVVVEVSLDRTTNKLSAKGTITTGNSPAKIVEFDNFTNSAAPTPTPSATPTPTQNVLNTANTNTAQPWIDLAVAAGAVVILTLIIKKVGKKD